MNYFHELLQDIENHKTLPYKSELARSKNKINAARRLHARVYLDKGFVEPGDIESNGYLTRDRDPYTDRARYFLVEKGSNESNENSMMSPVATGRQIEATNNSFDSFQFFEKTNTDKNSLNILHDYEPSQCVEVSALVKAKGEKPISVFYLYREMLHYSLKADHKLWLMVINVEFYEKLQLLFGDTIRQVGEPTQLSHLNMTVTPAVLSPHTALQEFTNKSRQASNSLEKRYIQAITHFFSDRHSS